MKKILTLLGIALLIACSSNEPIESKSTITGTYIGSYQCASCDWVKWSVTFEQNGDFSAHFFGKDGERKASEKGKWQNNEGLFSVESEGAKTKGLKFTAIDGHYISTSTLNNSKSILGKYKDGEQLTEAAAEGFDVIGLGKTNNWGIKVKLGKSIVLSHPAFAEPIKLDYHKPLPDYEQHTYTWKWENNGNPIELKLIDEYCNNGMPASMVVTVNGKERAGCVQYVHPNFLLQHIWRLTHFKGEELIAERYSRGLPILEMDAFTKGGMGHTGCNVWSGGIKVYGNRVVIMPGAMSNLSCGWPEFERDYVSTIGQEFEFEIANNVLHLKKNGEEIFRYERLDRNATTDLTAE